MQPTTPTPAPATRRALSFRAILWIVLLIAFAFALGWGPQEMRKRELQQTLNETRLELRLYTLLRQLGVASHEVQRNDYVAAANAARAFFDGCRSIAAEYPLDDRPRTRVALTGYAAQADTILGELSLGDPMAKQRLSSMYLVMDGVLQRKE